MSPIDLDLEQLRRGAKLVVAELREWARRDRDGWDVARARGGRAVCAPWMGERGRASALRGARRSAAAHRGLSRPPRGTP